MKTVEFNLETESNNVFDACGLSEHSQEKSDKHSAVLARITKKNVFTPGYGISDSIKEIIDYSRQVTGAPADEPYTEHAVLSVVFSWLGASAVESTKNEMEKMMSELTKGMPEGLKGLLLGHR